jgi:hypothetical protein
VVGQRRGLEADAGDQPPPKRSKTATPEDDNAPEQQQGDFSFLLQQLCSKDEGVQEAAAERLCRLSANFRLKFQANQTAIIAGAASIIAALEKVMSRNSVAVPKALVESLASLSLWGNRDSMVSIAAMPGCLATLSRVLSSNSTVAVKKHAAVVLQSLAIGSPAAVAAELGCIRGLVQLLSSNNEWAQYHALTALRHLACCSADRCKAIMAEPGCLTSMVQLLSSDSTFVSAIAAFALRHLVLAALPADTSPAISRELDCLKLLELLLNSDRELKAVEQFYDVDLRQRLSLVVPLTALQPSS